MNREEYLEREPFSVSQPEKETLYREQLNELTKHHRKACRAYDDICNGLNQAGPYLPVSLFKDLELKSVPDEKIIRRITSSGTTGQQVSKIYLDADTSVLQQRALCTITGDFIGTKRIPMLIIDSPDVLRDRSKFTARGAGILGFSMMASKRVYALDENMQLDMESLKQFEELAKAGPTFAFGFTYMIWEYLYEALRKEGKKIDLSGCHLIHGGGWKKLQSKSVSDEEYRAALKEVCGIRSVSDYYGMAEQTGSIFMQCEEGHLHASTYSDISILDPEDFTECETGRWGLIALDSLIPTSYPGHRLLTEDWGRILGTDDCPCGRKGKYFEISGRIKKAEVRGCSDTFEGAAAKAPQAAEGEDLQILGLGGPGQGGHLGDHPGGGLHRRERELPGLVQPGKKPRRGAVPLQPAALLARDLRHQHPHGVGSDADHCCLHGSPPFVFNGPRAIYHTESNSVIYHNQFGANCKEQIRAAHLRAHKKTARRAV